MSRKVNKNARQLYAQTVLAGWSSEHKSGKEGSDSSSSQDKTGGAVPGQFWQQAEHIIFVPIIIKQVKSNNANHECEVSIPTNIDIPVRVHRTRSKTLSQFTTYLLATEKRDTSKLRLVSGISEGRLSPLSHYPEHSVGEGIAYIYSRIMDAVNRAERCIVHVTEGQKNTVNEGSGISSTLAPKDLGKSKTSRRSKKIRSQVRDEEGAKNPAPVDTLDGQILGDRSRDGQD